MRLCRCHQPPPVPTFARRRPGIFEVVPKDAAGPDVRRARTAGGTLNRSTPSLPPEKRPPLFHLQPVSHPVVDPVPGEQVLTTPPQPTWPFPSKFSLISSWPLTERTSTFGGRETELSWTSRAFGPGAVFSPRGRLRRPNERGRPVASTKPSTLRGSPWRCGFEATPWPALGLRRGPVRSGACSTSTALRCAPRSPCGQFCAAGPFLRRPS